MYAMYARTPRPLELPGKLDSALIKHVSFLRSLRTMHYTGLKRLYFYRLAVCSTIAFLKRNVRAVFSCFYMFVGNAMLTSHLPCENRPSTYTDRLRDTTFSITFFWALSQ
ncbi:Uncharacterized protein HZ326_1567 [Fusarium oxysporum f. sp. albedinis]|nr:Uncharacterized protein HZ326_1567 [Fusarium oxysporum f. sp. albedinis]